MEECSGVRAAHPDAPPSAIRPASSLAQGASGIPGIPRVSPTVRIAKTVLFLTPGALPPLQRRRSFPVDVYHRPLRLHSFDRRDWPASGAEISDCYSCEMDEAFGVVYSGDRAPIRLEEHFL